MKYKEIDIKKLSVNPATVFDEDWALLSAGNRDSHNSMLVSWGTMGTLWGKPVAMAFVRPQRYTFEFMEKNDTFSLSFYDKSNRAEISPFGSKSGRDCDKYSLTGLQPLYYNDTVFVDNAKTVLICRKAAVQDIDPVGFTDNSIDSAFYAAKDYHRIYIGEIVACLVQDN